MKKNKKRKSGAILIGGLVFLMLLSMATLSLDAGVCERALAKCGVDAVIAGISGGPGAGVIWGIGCLAGYNWCLLYLL